MADKAQLNPAAMPIDDAARLLASVSGRRITVEMLADDIEDDAPTNSDGTLNLVHYAAWLAAQMRRGEQ